MRTAHASIKFPEGTLRVEREMTPVHSLDSPLPYWKYTDEAGHRHKYESPVSLAGELIIPVHVIDHYPTLRYAVDVWCHCDGDLDGHDGGGHYECKLCGEHIRPARGEVHDVIFGPVTYYLNDEPITEERYQEMITRYENERRERQQREDAQRVARQLGAEGLL